MELAAASTVATFCLPSTGFARAVASKTMSSAKGSARALCDWSTKPRRHPSTLLPSYPPISTISLLSWLPVPHSLWQFITRVQDLIRTPRYRKDIDRGSRTRDIHPRPTWRTAVSTAARRHERRHDGYLR